MKIYEKPELEIVKFKTEDILAESSMPDNFINPDITGGTTTFKSAWLEYKENQE